jgi:hypothetical protein
LGGEEGEGQWYEEEAAAWGQCWMGLKRNFHKKVSGFCPIMRQLPGVWKEMRHLVPIKAALLSRCSCCVPQRNILISPASWHDIDSDMLLLIAISNCTNWAIWRGAGPHLSSSTSSFMVMPWKMKHTFVYLNISFTVPRNQGWLRVTVTN